MPKIAHITCYELCFFSGLKSNKMRKVKFKKWLSASENANLRIGKWEDDFIHEGIFHQWANAYEEFETGAGNYTIGIVELPNGEIKEVLPTNIKFVE